MHSTPHKLQNTARSFSFVFLLGLLAGVVTRLSDFFPYEGSLWSFASIATLFGFWMVTVTLVICFSSSNGNAALNVFLYLFGMTLAFYGLQYVLGLFLPRFSQVSFQWSLFALYTVFSLVCAVIGFVLYFWNRGGFAGSLLYALPVAGLAAETLGTGAYLYSHHMLLFQFLFDLAGALAFGVCFYRRAARKGPYLVTVAVVALIGYFLFYRPFL